MNDLYDNFKAALAKKPEDKKVIQFKCNKKDGKFQLLEIYICVDKKGVALDCPTPNFIECGDNGMAEIRYPDKWTPPSTVCFLLDILLISFSFLVYFFFFNYYKILFAISNFVFVTLLFLQA